MKKHAASKKKAYVNTLSEIWSNILWQSYGAGKVEEKVERRGRGKRALSPKIRMSKMINILRVVIAGKKMFSGPF